MSDPTCPLLGASLFSKEAAQARVTYLDAERRADYVFHCENLGDDPEDETPDTFESEDGEELRMLSDMIENAQHCSGSEFVEGGYFEDYARSEAFELSYASSAIDDFVDWGRWADHLKQDYKDVAPPGYTYWCRS